MHPLSFSPAHGMPRIGYDSHCASSARGSPALLFQAQFRERERREKLQIFAYKLKERESVCH